MIGLYLRAMKGRREAAMSALFALRARSEYAVFSADKPFVRMSDPIALQWMPSDSGR